jgi:hypothetical protein
MDLATDGAQLLDLLDVRSDPAPGNPVDPACQALADCIDVAELIGELVGGEAAPHVLAEIRGRGLELLGIREHDRPLRDASGSGAEDRDEGGSLLDELVGQAQQG